MTPNRVPPLDFARPATQLTGKYARIFILYIIGVWVTWQLGFEAIYRHLTPFYALYWPVFDSWAVPALAGALASLAYVVWRRRLRPMTPLDYGAWIAIAAAFFVAAVVSIFAQGWTHGLSNIPPALMQLSLHGLVIAIAVGALTALAITLRRLPWLREDPPLRIRRRMVAAIVLFAFVFPAAVAMLRGGPEGITRAYDRHAYEYIGDIGAGGSIRGLFRDYDTLRPYLSMHSKVHPPGPIALLWFMSYFVGRSPMALSLATMALGALAVIPMYKWAKAITDARTGMTCAMLYAAVPAIVLFTATSIDIAFMPFTLTTMYLFSRALHTPSRIHAVGAGALYAVLSMLSFSLIGVGAFFGMVGLYRLREPERRRAVFETAAIMLLSAAAVVFLVWLWSGYNPVDTFYAAKEQFDTDQRNLDRFDPRAPAWMWKVLNPLAWAFYAGIPITVLFIYRLRYPVRRTRGLFLAFALTLLALDLLYLARGEGERSAMYVFPFLIVPAGHLLSEFVRISGLFSPLVGTLAFLMLQTWLMEAFLFTYW